MKKFVALALAFHVAGAIVPATAQEQPSPTLCLVNCQQSAAKIIVEAQHTFAVPEQMAMEVVDMCREEEADVYRSYNLTKEQGDLVMRKRHMYAILSFVYKWLVQY